jgi:hypothetical protein
MARVSLLHVALLTLLVLSALATQIVVDPLGTQTTANRTTNQIQESYDWLGKELAKVSVLQRLTMRYTVPTWKKDLMTNDIGKFVKDMFLVTTLDYSLTLKTLKLVRIEIVVNI